VRAVAGATGQLGRHVVGARTAAGHEVIPVTAGSSSEQGPATDFFTTAARNLQQAGERAGVARYVVVSIIAIQRVAQFHELVELLMEMGRQGDVIYLPQMRTQIISARTVAGPTFEEWLALRS
jgi:uncharacterized protein YbjT (DUF2867 family)